MTVHHRSAAAVKSQDGDIVGGWLLQLLVFLVVVGVVGYDLVAVGITAVTLDGQAREVAVAARDAYRASDADVATARAAARTAAGSVGVELVTIEVGDEDVQVTIEGEAETLLVQRIGALRAFGRPDATGRARLRP